MARMSDEGSAGQSDSSLHHGKILDANAGHTLTLPGHEYVSDAQILRDGQDLVLRPPHGEEITIKNYFTADPAPILSSGDGATLTHDLVDSFVKPIGGVQYAQNGSMDDSSPVGMIKESSGEATVTHTNGTVEKAAIGTPIFEGDVVETKDHGAVNITFVDKTTFAVSENAKMAIDQYVFDPATQHGENNFSVLRGVFVFTSGLIGHADPDDVKIATPVGSIGIRGTTIMGTIAPGGNSHISVVEGAIVVSNAAGEKTLSQQFETVQLHGMNQPMTSEGVLSSETMTANYNVLRTVSGPLFSTFDDLGKKADQPAATTDGDQTPAQQHDAAPATDAAPANKSDATQPAQAPAAQQEAAVAIKPDLAIDKTSNDSGFDTSAGLTNTNVFTNDTVSKTALSGTASAAQSLAPPPAQASAPVVQNIAPPASAPVTTAAPAVNTPGTTTGTTTAPVLPPLALAFTATPLATADLVAGKVVASIVTTIAYTGVSFSWAHPPTDGNGDPLFVLTSDGTNGAKVTLTTAGAAFLHDGSDVPFNVTATLLDGRTTTGTGDVNVHDVVVAPLYDLLLNNVIGSGTGGTFIPSTAVGSQHGYSTTALGDYNHDGLGDYAFTNNTATGALLYIDDTMGNHYTLNLSSTPYIINDTSNVTISSAGDFNRDGKGDLIIGAWQADQNPSINSGTVFILNGASPSGAAISITGFTDGQFAGFSVSGAGDYNGDGYADVIIGAPETSGTGHAYVLFGHAGTTPINVTTLTASQGFVITGASGLGLGSDVAGIGDFNKDGYSDIAVSSPGNNSVMVHFGNVNGTDTTPLTINGFGAGSKPDIIALGDINGDGTADIGIRDDVTNNLHIFYGGSARAGGSVAASASDVILHGPSGGGSTMIGASEAGDFNGDGRNDIMVALRNGSNVDVYVVYGSSSLAGSVDVTSLSSDKVFHMSLDLTSSQFNLANPATDAFHLSLSTAGDLNDDGYDDLMIGISSLDSNGGSHTDDGGLLLIQGRAEAGTITAGTTATASNQSLVGMTGADTLNTSFAGTSINAGNGDDTINLNINSIRALDGGNGHDTLNFLQAGGSLDLRAVGDNLKGIEQITLGTAGQTLTLGLDQVFHLMQESDVGSLKIATIGTGQQFTIDSNATGVTSLTGAGFTDAGVSGGYHQYTMGGYSLYVSVDATTTVANV